MIEPEEQTELEGQIENLTYVNEENGYTVAKVRVSGHSDPVTIVGQLISPTPGEVLRMKGLWINHPRFGRQFKVMSHCNRHPEISGLRSHQRHRSGDGREDCENLC